MKTRAKDGRGGLLGEVLWLAAYVVVAGWVFDQIIRLF